LTSTQVRCERNSWRACAWAGTSRAPRTTATTPRTRLDPSAAILWFGLYVVAFLILIGLAVAFGAAFWFGAAAVLVLGAIATYVYAIGTMWWAAGAGEPVLLVEDGLLHGRIRPVAKRTPAGPATAGWWDFVVPTAELTGVRLSGTDGRPLHSMLIVGLPAETSMQLVNEPATGWYAKRWLSRNGSPAVWPVGRMLRRAGRRQRLDQLFAQLQARVTQH
jgi:hypothetical protein